MLKRQDHWSQHAQQWEQIGAPLRPWPQDIEHLQALVAKWAQRTTRSHTRAVLLGVTPEIIRMRWPEQTELIAADRSIPMIQYASSQHAKPNAWAICADWKKMPFTDNACQIVVGDGCFSLLDFPEGYHSALQSIRRILTPQGLFAMRFFVRPAIIENLDNVFDDLYAGRIGNFHVFKWRLAMALHSDSRQGVRLGDIWDAWHQYVPAPEDLAKRLNWEPKSITTINVYKGIDTRYTFPTLEEVRDIVKYYFSEQDVHFPTYELGERCPTLAFHPLP